MSSRGGAMSSFPGDRLIFDVFSPTDGVPLFTCECAEQAAFHAMQLTALLDRAFDWAERGEGWVR